MRMQIRMRKTSAVLKNGHDKAVLRTAVWLGMFGLLDFFADVVLVAVLAAAGNHLADETGKEELEAEDYSH